MTFRALLAGCWRSHDFVRTRNAQEAAILRCMDCGQEIPLLQSDVVIGPAHHRQPDLGARTMKAKRVTRENVRQFERQSQR